MDRIFEIARERSRMERRERLVVVTRNGVHTQYRTSRRAALRAFATVSDGGLAFLVDARMTQMRRMNVNDHYLKAMLSRRFSLEVRLREPAPGTRAPWWRVMRHSRVPGADPVAAFVQGARSELSALSGIWLKDGARLVVTEPLMDATLIARLDAKIGNELDGQSILRLEAERAVAAG